MVNKARHLMHPQAAKSEEKEKTESFQVTISFLQCLAKSARTVDIYPTVPQYVTRANVKADRKIFFF
jgi:hypothetical protein